MKARRFLASLRFAACAGAILASCDHENLAGKTTTTSNGGGLVATAPDGRPLAGCVALAARSWNPSEGVPGIVDTLPGDSSGTIRFGGRSYAFVEIRGAGNVLGARILRPSGLDDGNVPVVRLDTVRRVEGRWADRSGAGRCRIVLDSSFQSAYLRDDGGFVLESVPVGEFALSLDEDDRELRPMGRLRLDPGDLLYLGSGNVLVSGDTTDSPLLVDDFESGRIWPMLKPSHPGVSPWYMWWQDASVSLPASNDPASIPTAIVYDPVRGGKVFQSRFSTNGPNALIAVGITDMEIDLRARSRVCFAYRVDAPLRVEFQRDSVSGGRPMLGATLPAAPSWRDTCVPVSGFLPGSDTPDSLKTWDSFARRVLVIEFGTSAGATSLGLDDVLLR